MNSSTSADEKPKSDYLDRHDPLSGFTDNRIFFCASAGLACCILSILTERFPRIFLISQTGVQDCIAGTASIILLVLVAFLYYRNGNFRLSRTPIVLTVSLGLSLILILGYAEGLASGGALGKLEIVAIWACRALSSILFIAWAERMYYRPERNSIAVFPVALLIAGVLRAFLYFLQDQASSICTLLLPAASGILLVYINLLCKRDPTLLGANGPHLLAHRMELKPFRAFLCSFAVTATCAAFLFRSIRNTWLPLQDSSQVAMGVSLGGALGTILAGIVIYLIVRFECSHEVLDVARLFALPFVLLSLYLASKESGASIITYVTCLELAQKILLFLAWLAPYWYENAPNPFSVACFVLVGYRLGQLLASLSYMAIDSNESVVHDILRCAVIMVLIAQLFVVIFVIIDRSRESGRRVQMIEEEARESARAAAAAAAAAVPPSKAELDARLFSGLAKDYGLTSKEREVLEFLAAGRTVDHIAQKMVVSVNTVRSHRQHIYAKMGLHSQQELLDLVEERRG
ncbi:MAG: helix-turn-helix transcriptional regulator [Coriobacteriales bacterium]|nr:helix-turn-helix transcriptional regulator [Coriobacteriales bacterium]